jgi:hypothetical protein
MKRFVFGVVFICAFSACTRESRDSDWPNDVEGLVEHLNKWPKDELDALERPEAHREDRRVASGDTGGWAAAHKERLRNLGAEVRWDHQNQRYVLVENQ